MSAQLTEIAWNSDLPVEQKLVYLAVADAAGNQWDGMGRQDLVLSVSRMTRLDAGRVEAIIEELDSAGRFQ